MSAEVVHQLHPTAYNELLSENARLEEALESARKVLGTQSGYQKNVIDNVRLLAQHISARLLSGRKLDAGGAEAIATLGVDPTMIFFCAPRRFLDLLGIRGGRADYLAGWAKELREANDAES